MRRGLRSVTDTVVPAAFASATSVVRFLVWDFFRATSNIAAMGARTDDDSKKKQKRAEFEARLVALDALKAQLTPTVLQAAFSNFQNTVQDQQRIPELADKYRITNKEARIIMQQATISSQEDGNDDSVRPAQIWDRANRLCGIRSDAIRHVSLKDDRDIVAIATALEAGEEPVLTNDRANILAGTMLQAANSVKV